MTASGVPEEAPERLLLSGLVFHSGMELESVKTRVEGDVLRVEVRGAIARKGVGGNLDESIALPAGIREGRCNLTVDCNGEARIVSRGGGGVC